jgi:uncharacterized membrane protein (UPF0182 family)
LFGLVYFSQNIAWFLTDWMWFDGIGQGDVFTTTILARLGTGGTVGLIAAGVLFLNGAAALQSTKNSGLSLPGQLAGSPLETSLNNINLNIPVGIISILLGVLMGLAGQILWEDVLLFIHGGEFAHTDPIFGFNASFYVFTLPIMIASVSLVTGMLFLSGIISGGIYFLRGAVGVSMREVEGRFVPQGAHMHPSARRHLGILAALWLFMQSASALLARYSLMYNQGGVTDLFAGPGYADQYGTLPTLYVKAAGFAIGAILIGFGLSKGRLKVLITGVAFAAAGWVVAAGVPNLIQTISVTPNELTKEEQRIDYHIAGTRFAFQIQEVDERRLDGKSTLSMSDIQANRGTVQNIRLWDHGPLLDTFSQVQEIRTYYSFASVDNDRYMIDGQLRQIMLSPRELVTSGLQPTARTWVNETMGYTHGYGLALGPVNEKTEQGLPVLFIEDLPPKINKDAFKIDQPALYYGETMDEQVFVNTEKKEFDYPNQDGDVYTHYSGDGGISVANLFTRVLLSIRMGAANVLLTGNFNDNSKVLLYRNIRQRVNRVAPFLQLDRDPYMIIADGRLTWMIDAYTTTDRFPYSQALKGIGNYMRNSVKITIDAYDGTLSFYQMDKEDPIINAWNEVFPNLMKPANEMPKNLHQHIRYPADFFSVQAHLFATYHMTKPGDWYLKEDLWEVPIVQGRQMEPYYTVMKVPGEESEEFILMLPFVPKDRPNLAAWMVARADGENYGEMLAYTFPKESMVYGPEMIVARINQDDAISEKLSLWNQQGSQAVLGTLMVIPIEESLIYVQPLYLRADTGSIPELKRVIVGYKNQIAMEPTLDEALVRIFGSVVPSEGPATLSDTSTETPDIAGSASSTDSAAQQAHTSWKRAKTAAETGDWSLYGEEINRLGQLLQQLAEPPVDTPVPSTEGTE